MRISALKHAHIGVRLTVAATLATGLTAAVVGSAGAATSPVAAKAVVATKATVATKAAAAAKTTTAKAAVAKTATVKKTTAVKKAAAATTVVHAATVADVTYSDDINGWVAEAQAVLAADGDQVPSADAIEARAMTESSDNPDAENHWDENQALYGGTYGLMQMIQPTFDQWALPGYTDIMNPVDSIVASVRYANYTYGSFDNIAYGTNGY